MKYAPVQNYENGQFVNSSTNKTLNVVTPVDGALLSAVPLSSVKDLVDAVTASKAAFPVWSKTTVKERVQVFFATKFCCMYTFVRWDYIFIALPLCINKEQIDERLAIISDAISIADGYMILE